MPITLPTWTSAPDSETFFMTPLIAPPSLNAIIHFSDDF